MRQILLIIDGFGINIRTLDFACYFTRFTHSKLTAVLMNSVEEAKDPEHASILNQQQADMRELESTAKRELFMESKRIMSEACSNRGIKLQFAKNADSLDDLIKESRFSDLIIADAAISFEKKLEPLPTVFLKHLLEKTECPVIVAPESFDAFEELIFTYDGNESSMFAIRQFTYLFPEFTRRKLTVLEVGDEDDRGLTEKKRLHRWLENYYHDVHFELLHGKPRDQLLGHLLKKEKILVVMGAFGRTVLSSCLSKGNADLLLKAVDLPIFISHR